MAATGAFAFNIDLPGPGPWHFAEPTVELAGWVCSTAGVEYTDLRGVLDGKVFLGLYGLDRPDIEEHLKGGLLERRSGFRLWVSPWIGAKSLSLQLLDRENRWVEFHRADVTTSGPLPPNKPKPVLRAKFVQESLFYLYRYFHYRSRGEIRREADRLLDELTAESMVIYPGRDLHGVQEIPGHWIHALHDKFRLNGWMFSDSRQIKQVTATIGPHRDNRMIWGQERTDVGAAHPQYPMALRSNFYGLVDIPADTPSPACLKIFCEYADGEKVLFFTKRLFINKQDEHVGPVPVFREHLFWYCVWALTRGALAGHFVIDDRQAYRAAVLACRRELMEKMVRREPKPPAALPFRKQDPFTLWRTHNRITPRLAALLRADGQALAARPDAPLLSIVVPVYNTPRDYLEELIDAVKAQFYPKWELCLADDASTEAHVRPLLEHAARTDSRIKPVFRSENGHIAAATNSALDVATGDYVAFLDHDDLLTADALLHFAEAIVAAPQAGLLYSDEDKIDDTGRHYDPQFKGRWSPEMAITHNFVHHLVVMRRELVERAGRLRPGFTGAQDLDLILRVVELCPPVDGVVHVPYLCYHWRAHPQSTASRGDQKGYLFPAARRAIEEACARRGLRAKPFLPAFAETFALCLHQLRWDPALLAENPVTIVIPHKDRADLLERCLASLDRTVNWRHACLVVVDDGSTDPATLELYARLEARRDLPLRVLRANHRGEPFNYARLVNAGTALAETPLVLHLNNDVEAREPGWLEDMVGWMSVPGVGVVGAKLVHPDGTLNHAGIVLGPQGGLADALFTGQHESDFGYLFLPHAARNCSAVTGACLLTRTDLYQQLGGFDESAFPVAYNDIDFCLRAADAGHRTVYTPQAVLVHQGSATRGNAYSEHEHLAFVARYEGRRDPYISEVLEYAPPHLRPDATDHRYSRRPIRPRIAILTHNLKFEGAPLIALELAKFYREHGGCPVRAASMQEGPLRREFEEAGIPVEVIDTTPIYGAKTPEQFDAAVAALARSLDWSEVDLVVCNTLANFWGVHVARALGKPNVLYVHESIPVKSFFAPSLAAQVQVRAQEALAKANRVIFTARASRAVFEEHNLRDNFRTIPTWIDLKRIRAHKAATTKEGLRRKHGLPVEATIVANIGSICQRKGQHIFVRAIDHFRKHHAAAFADRPPLHYLLVGGREGIYMESLVHDIELLGLKDHITVVDETRDALEFFRLADMFVCTSFEESSPRVLLEAMGYEVPIVSTNVHGIPEMVVDKDEALLVPAGDHIRLSDTLKLCLEKIYAGDTKMTSMALSRVSRHFDTSRSLPKHLRAAREAYLEEVV